MFRSPQGDGLHQGQDNVCQDCMGCLEVPLFAFHFQAMLKTKGKKQKHNFPERTK